MHKFALAIVVLVVVAGCTGPRETKVDLNNGIIINAFSAFPPQARSGNTVLFDIDVENVGGTVAGNVEIELIGIQDRWRDTTPKKEPITDTQKKGPFNLRPPSLDQNLPGDFITVQWELTTPRIAQGISPVLPVEARVKYNYNTSGYIDVFALTRKQLELRELANQPITSTIVEVNSPGPLKMTVPDRFKASPFIIDTDDTATIQQQTLMIEFTNVGSGFPITDGTAGKLTGLINITGPGTTFDRCFGKTLATSDTDIIGKKAVRLESSDILPRVREDGKFRIPCIINITKSAWATQPEGRISLQFELFYSYFVSEEVAVQVIGTGR
ncbi:MAG: hypothetical protein HYY37_02565 [Candidatus Aenigmarchaeota archaeon]|nr:hypothetical protein [Candidatus Aenigmarchaeota archaeon]